MSYLALNIALALSYLIYRLVAARELSLAKWTLVGALVLGAAYPLIPARRLRVLRVAMPTDVRYDPRDAGPAMRVRVNAAPAAVVTPPAPTRSFPWWTLLLAIPLIPMWRLRRLLRSSIEIRRIGRVSISISDDTAIPFSFLARRAHVVVPSSLVGSPHLALAIRHELQHHRQGDTRWIYFLELVRLVFFANPAAYAWKSEIQTLREFACDRALLRGGTSAREYGHCLLAVAQSVSPAFTAGMKDTQLKRRILMLAHPRTQRPARYAAGIIVTASLGLAGLASANLAPKPDHAPKTEPRLQAIAESALRDGVAKAGARAGYAIVQDVKSGQVLAVAAVGKSATVANFLSEPTEPWSVMKPILAAAAVNEKATRWDETHDCEKGKITIGGKVYEDWQPFDKLTTAGMVAQSSNICAIKVMLRADRETLLGDLKRLGFGEGSLTADYPQAGAGTLPRPTSDDFAPILIGGAVGLLVTPIEVTGAFVAMANGGKVLNPREYDAADTSPSVAHTALTPETASGAREALRRVVLEGTGTQAASALYTTAGKTGTGRKWVNGKELQVAAFAGLAPVSDPRVVVYVTVLDPAGGQAHGGGHAAPVFKVIAEKSLQTLGVAPDRMR